MCGIVGLYLKNEALKPDLGKMFAPMLVEMTDRGPDSAGFAIYRDPVDQGQVKFTLASDDPEQDWKALDTGLEAGLGCDVHVDVLSDHAIVITDATERDVRDWLAENMPQIRVVGSGTTVEIFKQTGLPAEVCGHFALEQASGSHAIGHTRMATESAVTTAGSHPFATGLDLCLVHNGSLSNHNRLRRYLARHGVTFDTENDTEVAAGYMTWKLRDGASLRRALEDGLDDLDGFYTFVAGTRDGFAVLRDPIACKPAVLAETDDYVAFGSEYRALATLPDIGNARVWEPEPGVVYSWGGGQ